MNAADHRFWAQRHYMILEGLVHAGGFLGIGTQMLRDRMRSISDEHRFRVGDLPWAPEDRFVRSVVAREAIRQLLEEQKWPTACEVNPW